MKFDESKFYLGKLCKRGHKFENSEQSLRFVQSHSCKKCIKEYYPIYYKKNKKKLSLIAKSYYKKNRKIRQSYQRNYYKQNKEKCRNSVKKWLSIPKNRKQQTFLCRRWERQNPEKFKKQIKDKNKRKIKYLYDSYVKCQILKSKYTEGLCFKDIPNDLVETKRALLLINREIRRQKI